MPKGFRFGVLVAGRESRHVSTVTSRTEFRQMVRRLEGQLSALPGVLHGSPSDIADTLRDYRDRYGVSYITVMEFHAQDFAR